MGLDIVFETSRFNLSEEKEHFINPCCFGEDLATWLREQLQANGISADEPGQEDWGWYTGAELQGACYFIGVGGNPTEEEDTHNQNHGEWRIMIEKVRSMKDRFLGKNKMTAEDPIFQLIREIIEAEADFEKVRLEQ